MNLKELVKNNDKDYFFVQHAKTNQSVFVKKTPLPEGSRELKALLEMRSNGVPKLLDYIIEEKHVLIAMQGIYGETLDAYFKRCRKIVVDYEIVVQAAFALDAIHKRKWLHRDIKPSNIIVDDMNRVYIVDFGTAIEFSEVSQMHKLEGTLDFMAPEAVFQPNTIDVRSDYYSLGKSFLQVLEKRMPFMKPELLKLICALTEELPENRPKDLIKWIFEIKKNC